MPHLHEDPAPSRQFGRCGASKIKFLAGMADAVHFKSAQDIQDGIFQQMSADKKLEIAAVLWLLAKALNPNKIDFRIHGGNRPAASPY